MANSLSDKIIAAIMAGHNPKTVRALGNLYERILAIKRNMRTLNPTETKLELTAIEQQLMKMRVYKEKPPFTISERVVRCIQIMDYIFARLAVPVKGKSLPF
jgi:hypothetical protein